MKIAVCVLYRLKAAGAELNSKFVLWFGNIQVKFERALNMAEINTIDKTQSSAAESKNVEKYGFTLKHIGINCDSKNEAAEIAGALCDLFGMERKEIRKGYSYFAGTVVECMSATGRGTHGHIAFASNNVEGALEYLVSKGAKIAEETCRFNENGECIFAYLQGEIGGFAIHITQQ